MASSLTRLNLFSKPEVFLRSNRDAAVEKPGPTLVSKKRGHLYIIFEAWNFKNSYIEEMLRSIPYVTPEICGRIAILRFRPKALKCICRYRFHPYSKVYDVLKCTLGVTQLCYYKNGNQKSVVL